MNDVVTRYLAETPAGPELRYAVRRGWQKFQEFCAERQLELCDVDAAAVRDFHQSLLWQHAPNGELYKPNSVDQFLRRVRQVLRWAFAQGLTATDASRHLVLSRPMQPVREVLAWDELHAVLSAFDRNRVTGLRDAALYAIVAETDLGVNACLELVVGQEEHLVLETATRDLVDGYLERGRPQLATGAQELTLFLGRGGRPLGRQAAYLGLQQAARAAGISGQVLARTLRRSYRAHFERQAQQRHFPLTGNPLTENC